MKNSTNKKLYHEMYLSGRLYIAQFEYFWGSETGEN